MTDGVNWCALGPAPRTGITVACIKAAVFDLQETLDGTTTPEEAWAIYEEACRLATTLSTLADHAGRRTETLEQFAAVQRPQVRGGAMSRSVRLSLSMEDLGLLIQLLVDLNGDLGSPASDLLFRLQAAKFTETQAAMKRKERS